MLEGVRVFGVELQRLALQGCGQTVDAQAQSIVLDFGVCTGFAGGLDIGLAFFNQDNGLLCLCLEKILAIGGCCALYRNLQRELTAFGDAFNAANQPVGR